MSRTMGRALAVAGLALACLMPVAGAGAETLRAAEAQARPCERALLPDGAAGTAHSDWTAGAQGLATIDLRGGSQPDWDLAVFRDGEAIAASTSLTSRERATAWVEAGDELVIQACRRAGDRPEVELGIDLYEMQDEKAPDPRISVESVTLSEDGDLAQLERLGFDVTHDVGPASATVVLYSGAERARLERAGFESITVTHDLVAADAAARAAEDEAVRALPPTAQLPSGRTSYRQYVDYTNDMKALAEQNPGLVRPVLVGQTFEGRPIEGVEIAAGVERTDDGRPVYLNFGLHHAREWPSGELPMEFAIDLVQNWNAGQAEVRALLERVRVIIVPVVNVDGFLASRSYGTNATDDNLIATLPLIINDQAAYKRKNCRPTQPGEAAIPCAQRSNSGVDLNRNYGAYWGGPGSSSDPTTQSYRGTGPFSEPESEAVHRFTSGLHPMVFITNHTFTEGRWLRQPGFDADFLPQIEVPTYDEGCARNPDDDGTPPDDPGAITPDEAAMKSLGDDMAAANGWISELAYETLCDITGATEDWNYYSQGTYGYTPEVRGPNFHANFADMVVAEYVGGDTTGDPAQQETNPLGIRESYLIAGQRAANQADHSVIEGTAPPGATLRLVKEFETPTCESGGSSGCPLGNGPPIRDRIETTLAVPESGRYEWHVSPSARPLHPGETYTMICEQGSTGGELVSRQVGVARGARATEDFERCGPPLASVGRCARAAATIPGTQKADRRLRGTSGRDVILALHGNDRIRGRGGNDVICAGGGKDRIKGGPGKDKIRAGGGKDRVDGGAGRDRCSGGTGKDRLRRCT